MSEELAVMRQRMIDVKGLVKECVKAGPNPTDGERRWFEAKYQLFVGIQELDEDRFARKVRTLEEETKGRGGRKQ